MKVGDLKVGMVVEVEKDNAEQSFCMILPSKCSGACVSGEELWFPLSSLDENLKYGTRQIVRVWDICTSNEAAHMLSATHRTLLWERKPPKELTVSQIEELLGYPVKIVKENQ